jgi:hypothetical protein
MFDKMFINGVVEFEDEAEGKRFADKFRLAYEVIAETDAE